MTCQLCGGRRARRACPALGHDICAVCCGTKRLVEIRCPSSCGYLAAAQQHPPAVVQRRQARDARFLVPIIGGLDERRYHLFTFVQSLVWRHRSEPLSPVRDDDVAQAAAALAATYETADRGIIYEHQAASRAANGLQLAVKAGLDELEAKTRAPIRRDAAAVLRCLERAASTARASLDGEDRAYLNLLERLFEHPPSREPTDQTDADLADIHSPRLIVT